MKKLLLIILLIVGCENPTEPADCAGVAGGTAANDDCGLCTGGTTGLEVNYLKDCAGECGGIEYTVGKDGQWYIYDINPLSILRASFKEEYGVDGWGMLADFFIDEYHKVVTDTIHI